MRYLAIFLLLFSANLFADNKQSFPGPNFAACSGGASILECFDGSFEPFCTTALNDCLSSGVGNTGMTILSSSPFTFGGITVNRIVYQCASQCTCPSPRELRGGYCYCPTGQTEYSYGGGSFCGPSSCPDGAAPIFDPSTNTMVCPTVETSSSASSQSCVVPGDYDGDCIPDDSSSAASSGAASSAAPSSGANSSGNDGNNDSGGSGSSSGGSGGDGDGGSTPGTGGGGSGPGTGTGTGTTPGGSSAGSNTSSGSDSSWTPNSGYGNWIPVSEGSNCPNKYEDANGQWWCAGSTGTGSSAGAGQCDPTSKDYLSCISQQQTPSSGGSGSSACTIDSPNYAECSGKAADSEGQLQQLGDKFSEDIDTQKDDYEQALDDDLEMFTRDGVSFKNEPNILKSALISFLPVSTPCNPPPLQILGQTYQLDCEYFNTFKQAFGWFLAVVTVWSIWQMAIRPVDR